MTITNGYCTQAELKSMKGIKSTNAPDDLLMDVIIEATSRFIDGETHRTFYTRLEVHYFDLPASRCLKLRDDLLSVTTLTNGDGGVIPASEYVLIDPNYTPKFELRLKQVSTYVWMPGAGGNTWQVIALDGIWGYATAIPTDINFITRQIAVNIYNNTNGQGTNASTKSIITPGGVIVSPEDVPDWAWKVLSRYRKVL